MIKSALLHLTSISIFVLCLNASARARTLDDCYIQFQADLSICESIGFDDDCFQWAADEAGQCLNALDNDQ